VGLRRNQDAAVEAGTVVQIISVTCFLHRFAILWPRQIRGASSLRWKTAASWTRSNGFPFYSYIQSYIQGMVDKTRKRGQLILTGSHQPHLHEAISQSLAGRTAMLSLWPFSIPEIRRYDSPHDPFDLIYRGFFPRLHEERLEPRRFFNGYLQTYVERDVRALIQLRDLSQFQKFLVLLAGWVGQIVNLASLGNDVGASAATFSMDFVKRLEWFQSLGLKRTVPGTILYNGERSFNVRGIRILNPLNLEDIWRTLTELPE